MRKELFGLGAPASANCMLLSGYTLNSYMDKYCEQGIVFFAQAHIQEVEGVQERNRFKTTKDFGRAR